MSIVPIILCGGFGKRLFPLSRKSYPKQFLSLYSKRSMFQETCLRLKNMDRVELTEPIVVCNDEHRFLVAEQAREINIKPKAIILEPVGRNTAPAIAAATQYLRKSNRHKSLLFVLPSDHKIEDNKEFENALEYALLAAEETDFVTFGIEPDSANTNYGYIKKGRFNSKTTSYEVEKFIEKPDKNNAKLFFESGDYYWNSGMFIFTSSSYESALKELAPEILKYSKQSFENAKVDSDFIRLDEKSFKQSPKDSIDYAVIEKLLSRGIRIDVIGLNANWSDMGSFEILWKNSELDKNKNSRKGDIFTHSTNSSYLYSDYGILATVGVNDLVVINTRDVVLVADKKQSEKISSIVDSLINKNREEAKFHRKVTRPWGTFDSIDESDGFKVKRLTVNSGAKLSLQMHHQREEFWVVVNGTARVTRDDEILTLSKGEMIHIPLGATHSLENPDDNLLEIIEVQIGDYLGEDDIVRFEDKYGRVEK